MARPRHADIDTATTDRLLLAAEREFGSVGFAGARLSDVARAAGIRRPSLLYHFPSKDDLYEAVVHRAFARLGGLLTTAMSGEGSFPERLDATVTSYLAFLDEHPAVAALVLRELMEGRGPGQHLLLTEVAPLLDRMEAFLRAGEGGNSGDGPLVRAALLQVASSALVRASAGPLRQPLWGEADHTRALVHLLFLGGAAHRGLAATAPIGPDAP